MKWECCQIFLISKHSNVIKKWRSRTERDSSSPPSWDMAMEPAAWCSEENREMWSSSTWTLSYSGNLINYILDTSMYLFLVETTVLQSWLWVSKILSNLEDWDPSNSFAHPWHHSTINKMSRFQSSLTPALSSLTSSPSMEHMTSSVDPSHLRTVSSNSFNLF